VGHFFPARGDNSLSDVGVNSTVMQKDRQMDDQHPRVFIGSSSEGLKIAREVESQLRGVGDVRVWKDGVFELGQGILESLMNALPLLPSPWQSTIPCSSLCLATINSCAIIITGPPWFRK
jgi:hypothetical protein